MSWSAAGTSVCSGLLAANRPARAGVAAARRRGRARSGSLGDTCSQGHSDYLGSGHGACLRRPRLEVGRARGDAESRRRSATPARRSSSQACLFLPGHGARRLRRPAAVFNGAVELETGLSARALLGALLESSGPSAGTRRVRRKGHGRSTSTCSCTGTSPSTSLCSRFRIPVCTSGDSSWSRLPSWIPVWKSPGYGPVQALLARLD